MSHKHTILMLAGLLAASLGSSTSTAADASAGKTMYTVCASCHGRQAEGDARMNAPNLTILEPWYVRRQMKAYQQGLRGTAAGDALGMQMRQMAMTVGNEAALDNLIAYLESLPDAWAETTLDGDASAGKPAYAVCATCHGPEARGNEQTGGPRLAGQDDWYLVRQLDAYRQGLRGYHSNDIYGQQMKPMATMLSSDQEIRDVMAYLNSLR